MLTQCQVVPTADGFLVATGDLRSKAYWASVEDTAPSDEPAACNSIGQQTCFQPRKNFKKLTADSDAKVVEQNFESAADSVEVPRRFVSAPAVDASAYRRCCMAGWVALVLVE